MNDPFIVPLSAPVLDLLRALPSYNGGTPDPDGLLFPTPRGLAYANSQLNDVLRKIGYAVGEATLHGLRTAVRSWIGDEKPEVPVATADAVIQHERRGKLRRILKERPSYRSVNRSCKSGAPTSLTP